MAEAGASRSRTWLGFLAFVLLLGALLSLGTWQVERLQWKEALLAEIDSRLKAAPVEVDAIAAMAARGEDVDYIPVRARGIFDHAHERYFLATRDGEPGYHVYTPFRLQDGRVVMVNRGFVPDELKDPDRRAAGEKSGEVAIVGLARAKLLKKPSWLVPDNEVGKNLYFWKDLDAMATSAGISGDMLVPFFIDADAAPNPGGYPIGGVTQVDLPNNHLSYAVTWYGLAAVLVVIAGLGFRKNRMRHSRQ